MSEPAYRLHEVGFGYTPGVTVLRDLSVEISGDEITAIVGVNGAGKSTLINLLAAMIKPMQGHIRFFGRELPDAPMRLPHLRIGLLPQNPYLFSGSVLDNVALGLKFQGLGLRTRRSMATDCLESLGLRSRAAHPARALSGGEAQKVALARLLVLRPRVLLLDEPFTYLDSGTVQDLESIFQESRRQSVQSIIFSSHDHLRARLLSDRIWNLARGRLFSTPAVNLYRGQADVEQGVFVTGRLRVRLPGLEQEVQCIAVEPSQVILSKEAPGSVVENAFQGRVVGLQEEQSHVWVTVDCGEKLHSRIPREAMNDLEWGLGSSVWVSFQVSAVTIL